MEIQKYEVLLKAVQYGSFSKTAQALDYTQSAITHIIHGIEKEWGVKLFNRGYAGVTLTAEGQRLLPLIQTAYDAELRIQEEIDTILGLQGGIIRIGAFTSISMHYLPKVIQDFSKLYPNVGFKIMREHYTVIEKWLLEDIVDVGFLPEPMDERLERKPILRDKYQVVLPIGHPLAEKKVVDCKDLEKESFIMLDEGERNEFEQLAQDRNITLNTRYWIKDDPTIIFMVRQGLGVSVLHELFLQGNFDHIVIRDLAEPVYRETMAACLPRSKRTPIIKAFLKHLESL